MDPTPSGENLRQVTQLDTMHPFPPSRSPSLDRGNANGRTTRERLMILAEAMFAERGIEAVSIRAIGQAAGQRNNNVVQYHFGDRANLVAAIYAFRSEALNDRRHQLLAQHRAAGAPDDARSLLRILVQPHAESIPDPENHFLGFLARLVVDAGSMANASSVGAAPFMGAHYELPRRYPGRERADRGCGLRTSLRVAVRLRDHHPGRTQAPPAARRHGARRHARRDRRDHGCRSRCSRVVGRAPLAALTPADARAAGPAGSRSRRGAPRRCSPGRR